MVSTPLLITAADLQEQLHDPWLRLIDTRYYLDGSDPLENYTAGHLPGAVYMDMERDLSGHPGLGAGRHPLPSASEFERAARAAGISTDFVCGRVRELLLGRATVVDAALLRV